MNNLMCRRQHIADVPKSRIFTLAINAFANGPDDEEDETDSGGGAVGRN